MSKRSKLMTKVGLLSSLAMASFTAWAGPASVSQSTVDLVRVDKSGKGYVVFDSPLAGDVAACRTSQYTRHLAFDANTAGGKAVLASALAAKASGATMTATSAGTCANYGSASHGVEDWNYGYMH